MRGDRSEGGVTVVDVVAVVFIVLLLGAMFTGLMVGCSPFAKAHRAAERMECASRMRQLGLAIFQYEKYYVCMPNAQQNVFRQIRKWLGLEAALEAPEPNVTDVFRCPSDEYLPEEELWNALSYAPIVDSAFLDGDDDGTPDGNSEYCAWSCFGEEGPAGAQAEVRRRNLTQIAPDTVLLVEYWSAANRLNLDQDAAGYLLHDWGVGNAAGTLDFIGTAAKDPLSRAADIGGYTFLGAFGREAEQADRRRNLTKVLHGGMINLLHADGGVEPRPLKDITGSQPKDIPLWTGAAD